MQTVSFAWFSKAFTVEPLALDPNGKGYYIATCRIAPAEMTYAITATLTIGGEEKMTDTYSAKQYADYILSEKYAATYTGTGAKSYANLKALVETMLDYGSRAQVRFNRNPDDLANGGSYIDHTDDPVSITPTGSDMAEGLETCGLAYIGTTVLLLTQTSIRHYYTITNQAAFDLIQDSVTFNGAPVSYTEKDEEIYFELKNIPASQLDTPYTLHIGDGDYDYAVLDYVSSCLAKTGEQANPKTQALVTAMYYYNKAANAYFAD
ncbi:MAG: hypothetical protein II163_08850 [Ruminococcus sp.]|nr:hypothetical protein [Ruminococcus sp.]